jgi:iron complex outermembrane receptor protein
MLRSVKRLPLVLAISAATLASSVHAQQLEEVIVTAQKRAENLQDVPISVSAIAGEKIQDATILNFAALADFVPSLHIAEASVNTNIYMRGIGSGNNRGFEQSVVCIVDGVYHRSWSAVPIRINGRGSGRGVARSSGHPIW